MVQSTAAILKILTLSALLMGVIHLKPFLDIDAITLDDFHKKEKKSNGI